MDGLKVFGRVLGYDRVAALPAAPATRQGWPELERRYQAALGDFAAGAGAWLEIVRHRGLDAAARVYREVLAGAGPSAAAHVIEPALRP